jgi:hypothetical protein
MSANAAEPLKRVLFNGDSEEIRPALKIAGPLFQPPAQKTLTSPSTPTPPLSMPVSSASDASNESPSSGLEENFSPVFNTVYAAAGPGTPIFDDDHPHGVASVSVLAV